MVFFIPIRNYSEAINRYKIDHYLEVLTPFLCDYVTPTYVSLVIIIGRQKTNVGTHYLYIPTYIVISMNKYF